MSPAQSIRPLDGAHILVVEDEAILALDLAFIIESSGGCVAGPMSRLDQAMRYDDIQRLDAAIIDVDIAGTEVFPLADRLDEANVPIVFHTGRMDIGTLTARYPEARVVRKPSGETQLVGALCHAVTSLGATARAAS